jgi:hypothetical protein
MADANSSLTDLYNTLVKAHDQVNAQRVQTDDDDLRDAMLTEMMEITHRIDLVQAQLFTQESDAIDNGVAKVDAAKTDLDTALSKVNSLKSFVNSCTAFLKVVDTAIDLAKKLP